MWKQIQKIITDFDQESVLETRLEFKSWSLSSLVQQPVLSQPWQPHSCRQQVLALWTEPLHYQLKVLAYMVMPQQATVKVRIECFSQEFLDWALSARIYFSIAFSHYLYIQMKRTSKTSCDSAPLIMYQIPPKWNFGCLVFKSSWEWLFEGAWVTFHCGEENSGTNACSYQ